jgi:hypothetical protein
VLVDAASRAAGRRFALTGSRAEALAAAQAVAARNPVRGRIVPLTELDLEFGVAERHDLASPYTFTLGGDCSNAVRIVTRSLALEGGSIDQLPRDATREASPSFPLYSAISIPVELDLAIVLDRSGLDPSSDPTTVNDPLRLATSESDPGFARVDSANWQAMVQAVEILLSRFSATPQRESVAVVSYSNFARTESGLESDYDTVIRRLHQVSNSGTAGGTNIGGGILQGLNALFGSNSRPWAYKVMVLITDGTHSKGSDPEAAADVARDQNIPIFTITFNDQADQAAMGSIALQTQGRHYGVTDADQLLAALDEIVRQLPVLLTH